MMPLVDHGMVLEARIQQTRKVAGHVEYCIEVRHARAQPLPTRTCTPSLSPDLLLTSSRPPQIIPRGRR